MYVKHSIILFEVGTYSDTNPVNIEICGGIEPTINKKDVRAYSVASFTKVEITSFSQKPLFGACGIEQVHAQGPCT